MSNYNKSSIDLFWNQLPEILPFSVDTETAVKLWAAFEQAKAMHKEEIVNAYANGDNDGYRYMNNQKQEFEHGEQYYNETFEGK